MSNWTEADLAAHLARKGVDEVCAALGRRQAPTQPIFLVLPFPPSVNTYWRKWKNRMVLSPRGRLYKANVSTCMLANYFAKGGEAQISAALDAELDFYPPDKRRRDQDNFEKGLWDALVYAGVLLDDSIIRNVQKRWHEPIKGGKVEGRLWPAK